jgi:hypothetical protein
VRPVTSRLEVEVATTPIVNVAPRYAVGIQPSSIDAVWDQMRVDIGGTVILRDFDPGYPIDTGAPILYTTVDGEQYETVGGDPYETVIEV